MANCPIHNTPLITTYRSDCAGTMVERTSSINPPRNDEPGEDISFEYLSPNEKRIWLARDILFQVKQRVYLPSAGAFLVEGKEGVNASCIVCALGALVVSYARTQTPEAGKTIKRNLKLGTCPRRYIIELLGPLFSAEQLELIEAAFEGTTRYSERINGRTLNKIVTASQMYHGLSDPEVLTRIMQNIIDNEGTFVV